MTPEQFVQGLQQRGIRIELEQEGPEPRFRLSGSGHVTPRIREYVRRNREGISALFAQSRCAECWRPVDEYEQTWQVSDRGDIYCSVCWRSDLAQPSSDAFEIEARRFLSEALRALAIFGPFRAQRVVHKSGRTWEPPGEVI